MTDFDPNQFLTQPLETLSTQKHLVPVGTYLTLLEKVEIVPWQSQKDSTKSGLRLAITYLFDDQALQEKLARSEVRLTGSIMLDMLDGKIDTRDGKNTTLARLREAADSNKDHSNLLALTGRLVRSHVTHRQYAGGMTEEINAWAKP